MCATCVAKAGTLLGAAPYSHPRRRVTEISPRLGLCHRVMPSVLGEAKGSSTSSPFAVAGGQTVPGCQSKRRPTLRTLHGSPNIQETPHNQSRVHKPCIQSPCTPRLMQLGLTAQTTIANFAAMLDRE